MSCRCFLLCVCCPSPVFRRFFVSQLLDTPSLVVAKMDAAKHTPPSGFTIESYPTILFVKVRVGVRVVAPALLKSFVNGVNVRRARGGGGGGAFLCEPIASGQRTRDAVK